MERWINMLETHCDPAREDEYNDWYNNMHIPDVLQTPGFVRARRFLNKEFRDGRGKYLAIYEIETEDIAKTMKLRLERRAQEHAQGRSSASRPNFSFSMWRDVLFRQFFERKAPHNAGNGREAWVNFVEQDCHPAREDEYRQWYHEMHIPDVLQTPGFVAATRYQIQAFRDGRGKYLAIYDIQTDDIDATMKLRLEKRLEEVRLGRDSGSRNRLTWPVWRDVLWKQISDQRAKP